MIKKSIKQIFSKTLNEGGASGHLMHLSDNHNLTFNDLKEVITQAAQGKLENVTEKLDGVNLMFSWVEDVGLRVARSKGDIKRGGLDASSIANKFKDRGNVLTAFKSGFNVLNKALRVLPSAERERVFNDGGLWYSLELIYSRLKNTVHYDSNNIVFHQSPVFEKRGNEVTAISDAPGVKILNQYITQMQKAVSRNKWSVRGPVLIRLKKISDGTIVQDAFSRLDSIMQSAGLSGGNTLQEYLFNSIIDETIALNIKSDVAEAIASRIAGISGAPNLNQIKKLVDPGEVEKIRNFVKSEKELKQKIMKPIELVIHNFAIEVLKGLESVLIADSRGEVKRLQSKLHQAIAAIKKSQHSEALQVLKNQMLKLQSVENLGSPMEGIVFNFKGNSYKFTGAFAPAHQILRLFTFGRKDIPTSVFESKSLKGVLLAEGGHAFSNVEPITIEDLKTTWPHIKSDLDILGVTDVRPIGTTWKKNPMGDVDLAARFEQSRDELYDLAADMFGKQNIVKVGANIVSISYPVHDNSGNETGTFVQVDVMLGDPDYLTWSRYGPSPEPDHEEYSQAKGVLRNMLLNVILRVSAQEEFGIDSDGTNRKRYAIDLDKGLFVIQQTRKSKANKLLKRWKTIKRKFITSNPDKILRIIFGDDITKKSIDILKLEDLVLLLRTNPKLGLHASKILSEFFDEVKEKSKYDSSILGKNPNATLEFLRKL